MEFETIKKHAEKAISAAKGHFILNDWLNPIIIGVSDNGIRTHSIALEGENSKEHIPILLKGLTESFDALIVVIDSKRIQVKKTINPETLTPKEIMDTSDVLVCFVYTKEKTIQRIIQYIPGNKIFFDQGWQKSERYSSEIFNNPFK